MSTSELLKEYLAFIVDFHNVIRKEYNISNNENIWGYIIGRGLEKGTIGVYNFIRHGSGFTVEKNGIICEYDMAPLNEYDIKFSFWKFKNFIETAYGYLIVEDEILKKDLSDMITSNIIDWLIIDGINWNIYQINYTVLQYL